MSSSTPKHPKLQASILPMGNLSTAAMVELAATKFDVPSLGDSSSTLECTPSPCEAASIDISGSQTIVDTLEIGVDTEPIPTMHELPSKKWKAPKEGKVAFVLIVFFMHIVLNLRVIATHCVACDGLLGGCCS